MFIKKLEIKKFRNYEELNIDFNSDKILLTGRNAQGKTNLLEAVYYISALSSFRAKSDMELIKWGENFCSIKTLIQKQDIDIEQEVLLNPPERRRLKINGIIRNKASEFISCLSCVCFTSSSLLLLRGAPEDRRRILDAAICRIFPAYVERLSKYNKIRAQKNNYLRSLKGNLSADKGLLDVWNEQLAISGSNIIYIRLNFLHELQKTARVKHKQISGCEDLTIAYNSGITGQISALEKFEHDAGYIKENFIKILEEKRNEEILRAQSVTGPHRDDIIFFIDGNDAKDYASQGQQRSAVLSLKLAELELIKDKTGGASVLLLDDVLAELDSLRQNYLLDAAEGSQTIITSADIAHFSRDYIKTAEIFEITGNSAKKLIS